jgi:type IV pilus assembly protein PilC
MNQDYNKLSNNEEIFLDISNEEVIANTKSQRGHKVNSLFDLINNFLIEISGVPLKDMLLFFQLLSAMVSAGLPILEGLQLLEAQMKNPKLKWVIASLIESIEGGTSLAQSMRENGDVFDGATCAVVEAGEKSGKLNDVLKELVAQSEQLDTIAKKIKSVMTYPVVVIFTMIILSVVVLIFVIPKLIDIFGSADQLPLPTRVMIAASDILQHHWLFLGFIVLSIIAGFNFWRKSASGSRQWGILLISLPIVGELLRGMILNRITRIFGFLISSGVPIVEGLKITSHIAENDLYKEKLLLAADDLTKGISIAENLSDNEKLFPPMLINMISIGEKSASLDTIMLKAADFYKSELDRKVDNLSKIMEPIILGFIALGAVFMILAIYLPILQMNDKIIG